jgi:hypothetical protein
MPYEHRCAASACAYAVEAAMSGKYRRPRAATGECAANRLKGMHLPSMSQFAKEFHHDLSSDAP